MDSNRIARLAQGARASLMADASDALGRVLAPESAERLARPRDVEAVERLAGRLGGDALAERVAYTWFNRLCALRFMDARRYTPVGCVTPRPGETLPEILADAREGTFHSMLPRREAPGTLFDPEPPVPDETAARVSGLLSGAVASRDALGEAYVLLLLAACDDYADSMGSLFGGDPEMRVAMRLLAPSDLLDRGSVLERIVAGMDDETCNESVEVLGWLYQFYVSERKDEFFASRRKARAEDIAPATQLFTPNWIVRYLTENSLGRLWMLNSLGSELASHMDYYIAPEGEAEDFVRVGSPEELTLCDPACGSGHILVYAFDLLYLIYEEEGYLPSDIPTLILENNLFGLEIDPRAAEIAGFALTMKARERDPEFLARDVTPHITVLEPVRFDGRELGEVGLLSLNGPLLDAFAHLDEVGSLYVPDAGDATLVDAALEVVGDRDDVLSAGLAAKLRRMRGELSALSAAYGCVVANPPYMGSNKFNPWMGDWIKEHYPDEKRDLCTCFIARGFSLARAGGYSSMVTMESWMFLSGYEKMRKKVLREKSIITLMYMNHMVMRIAFNTSASIFYNGRSTVKGIYTRVNYADLNDRGIPTNFPIEGNGLYRVYASSFSDIPGSPISYWTSEAERRSYEGGISLASVATPRQGLSTGKNDRFLRLWWEVEVGKSRVGCDSRETAVASKGKWFPCNKGGGRRRWYGNNQYVIDWEDDGRHLREFPGSVIRNIQYLFKEGITWSTTGSSVMTMRYSPSGFISEHKGSMCFCETHRDLMYCLAFSNTSVVIELLKALAPTVDFGEGSIGKLPLLRPDCEDEDSILNVSEESVSLSRADYDSFETSWDFSAHPLVPLRPLKSGVTVAEMYSARKYEVNDRFEQLRANEEEINRTFARIYGMEGEVPVEVGDKYVSVARIFDTDDDIPESYDGNRYVRTRRDEVASLVSYGVGCMLGRYSVDAPGLILADSGQTAEDFLAKVPEAGFVADADNVLPVVGTDDVGFDDDVVAGFRRWLAYAYGETTLDENVAFIEDALGEDLRTYFVRDFYKDHCATYSVVNAGKRPIYWMFRSPRGSFSAIVYMHRMDGDTVSTVLAEYVRPYRQKLSAHIGALRATGAARDAAKADRYQAMVAELEEWDRDVLYPLSQRHVEIDLDDGFKVNYGKFPGALASIA